MDNFSPKASAEANGIKVEFNFNFDGSTARAWAEDKLSPKEALPMDIIARVRRSWNPAKYEKNLAEARNIRTQSICDSYETYKRTMPSLSDRQAFLLASGYNLTPAEADNVTEVLSDASASAAPDVNPDVLSDQFKDEFIKGSATAYEDEIRDLWSKLLNSELTEPGTFSKRTLAVLKDMSREDAEAFEAFCSCSIFVDRKNPIPVLTELDEGGWTYNNGSMSVDQLNLVTSLGLVDTTMHTNYGVSARSGLTVFAEDRMFLLTNDSDDVKRVNFGSALYTPIGRQLSRLCPLGTASEVPGLIDGFAKRFGMSCQSKPIHFV